MEETQLIPVDVIHRFMMDVLQGLGTPPEEAQICAEVLITSDVRGIESHGVGRLKYYYDRIKAGVQNTHTEFEVVQESETTAVVDGHHGMGHVIAYRAMRLAMDKARQVGLGAVAVRNGTHFGIAGYYPLMAAQEGMVGFTFTNARPAIAPTFGTEPMLGTNPIAFAAPSDMDFPFSFDGATAISQRGKIEVAMRAEKPVPEGWVIDAEGQPLTDPAAIMAGLDKATAAENTVASVSNIVLIIGVLSVLAYFFFSKEHTGSYGRFCKLGIYFLMFSFGASFGYTVMARVSLLIGRVTFLLYDWLHIGAVLLR